MTDLTIEVGDSLVFLRRILGRGSFGAVHSAKHKDGNQVAAKLLDSQKEKAVEQEIIAFHKLGTNHENVVQIRDACTAFNGEYEEVWIIMELCEHGNLESYFRKHPQHFKEILRKLDMMCQIANGLEYLHGKRIVHRDIKPSNILVAKSHDRPVGCIAKLADFGLCRFLDPNDLTSCMNTNCGTRFFRAPEFFKGVDGKIDYHKNVDVFAAGLTFLAMIQPLRSGGTLIPQIEGATENESELSCPIGQIMFSRIHQNKRQVEIVVERSENPVIANRIRRVIKEATKSEPDWRIDASKLCLHLEQIRANPDGEASDPVIYSQAAEQQASRWPSAAENAVVEEPIPMVKLDLETQLGAMPIDGPSNVGYLYLILLYYIL